MVYHISNLNRISASDINLVVKHLEMGEVLVLPTDTIYGLSCLATDKEAVSRIFALKKRPKDKPFILLVSSLKMALEYVKVDDEKIKKIEKIWQEDKPTTIILPSKKIFPEGIVSKSGNISLRLPKSHFLIKIIERIKVPLVSTSLNLSGEPAIKDVSSLESVFKENSPDFIFDVGVLDKEPSRIIDFSGSEPLIIR
jgi:L-threonylcarbamoyladenylate synthase